MPVSEICALPLTHPITKDNPNLPEPVIQKLREAKKVLETASGYGFNFFQQIEDPSIVYITGLWDSAAAHSTFLPSPENQKLLELFKDDFSFHGDRPLTMWHLDEDVFTLDPASGLKSAFTAPTISYNRHFVPIDKKEGFIAKLQEVKGILEDYTNPLRVVGGWRIEKEEVNGKMREEWALFSGFDSVEHHMAFAKTQPFEKYREIVGFVDGFEVRHLKTIKDLS
jgi:heme-degrading monooxygenase HmoA